MRKRLDLTKQIYVAVTCIPDVLFEFRPEYPLLWQEFRGFPQSPGVSSYTVHRLSHECFLPNHSKFITNKPSYHRMLQGLISYNNIKHEKIRYEKVYVRKELNHKDQQGNVNRREHRLRSVFKTPVYLHSQSFVVNMLNVMELKTSYRFLVLQSQHCHLTVCMKRGGGLDAVSCAEALRPQTMRV